MRYYDDILTIADKMRDIRNGKLHKISEVAEVFINAAYQHSIYSFYPFFNNDFFEEVYHQAELAEMLMLYLRNKHIQDDQVDKVLKAIETHPHYRADIFLLNMYIDETPEHRLYNSKGVMEAIYVARQYLAHKEECMLQHLEAYVALLPESVPTQEIVLHGL